MPITLDRRPKGRYPFGVFYTSMGSTFCTESELKSDLTVGDLPSLVAQVFNEIPTHTVTKGVTTMLQCT